MLRLGQHIGSHPARVGNFICNHNSFRGSRQSIDAHHTIDLALRQGNEQISRAKDLIHRADRFCSISQCTNCLGTTK